MQILDANKLIIGTTEASKAYLGYTQVWPSVVPPPAPTGESGYYYYYQSETGMTLEEGLEAFDTDKIQGPAISSATQFSFYVKSARDGVGGNLVCMAVPQSKEFTRIMEQPIGQSAVQILPGGYFEDKVTKIIGEEPYTVYYDWAVWVSAWTTGYTEPCFYYLDSTANTLNDAVVDFKENRRIGEFIENRTSFSFSKSGDTGSIAFAIPAEKQVVEVYRNSSDYPISVTAMENSVINGITYTIYAGLFSAPYLDNWLIGIITN